MDNTTTEQDHASPITEPIRFRAGKKRKAYRQRAAEEGESNAVTTPILPSASNSNADDPGAEANPDKDDADSSGNDDDHDDNDNSNDQIPGESAVAAALRLRNARRAIGRRGGVGFRSDGRSNDDGDAEQQQQHALVVREQDRDADRIVGGITNRFMHQTGLLTILDDKHMNAYIESRLASRSAKGPQGSNSSNNTSSQLPPPPTSSSSTTANPHQAGQQDKWRDQPTRHGKLVEVNMADIANNSHDNSNNNKRRRVEKDAAAAKPPPRRGRNRRTSEDIARDALVEQFLRENRLDVYNVPSTSSLPHASASASAAAAAASSSVPGADPSADDRLAEQFRQQYYDEQAMRRKKKRPVQQQQQKQQAGDVLKGPKLGGSRNMRAAVRDILLQQEKEKKGR